jgi:hypothetical protein
LAQEYLEQAVDLMKHYQFAACVEVTNGSFGNNRRKNKQAQVLRCKRGLKSIAKGTKIKAGLAYVKSNFAITNPLQEIDFLINLKGYEQDRLVTAINEAIEYRKVNGKPLLSEREIFLLETALETYEHHKIPLENLISPSAKSWELTTKCLPKQKFRSYIIDTRNARGLVIEMYVGELFRKYLGNYEIYSRLCCPIRAEQQKKAEIDLLVICPENKFKSALAGITKDIEQTDWLRQHKPKAEQEEPAEKKRRYSRIEKLKYAAKNKKVRVVEITSIYSSGVQLYQRGYNKPQIAYLFIDSVAGLKKKSNKFLSKLPPESRNGLVKLFKKEFVHTLLKKFNSAQTSPASLNPMAIEALGKKVRGQVRIKYNNNSIEEHVCSFCSDLAKQPFEVSLQKLEAFYDAFMKGSYSYVRKRGEYETPIYYKDYDAVKQNLEELVHFN